MWTILETILLGIFVLYTTVSGNKHRERHVDVLRGAIRFVSRENLRRCGTAFIVKFSAATALIPSLYYDIRGTRPEILLHRLQ